MEVNGSSLYGLSHAEAVSLFRQLENGPLQLMVRRPLTVPIMSRYGPIYFVCQYSCT